MTDFADLGARFTSTGGPELIATTKEVGAAATSTASSTDKLNATQARHAKALRDYATAIKANAQANAVANQAAASGMRKLAEAEAAIRAPMMALPALHTKGAAAAKLQSHELLNLSRQFSDIGVTAAMGMNPLMILIQQGPQIAETMAMAAARGVTFKTALAQLAISARALTASLIPLMIQLAPFILVAAAVGAAIWVATKALSNLKEANEKTAKTAKALRDAMGEVNPTMTRQGAATTMAAEGAANYSRWLEDNRSKMVGYAQSVKDATVAQLDFNAAQARANLEQYRKDNTVRTARGVTMRFGANRKEFQANELAMGLDAANAQVLADNARSAPKSAFVDKVTGGGAKIDEAAQALKRLKEEFAELQKETNNPDKALLKVADNIALLDKAARAGLISGAEYSKLFMKLKEQPPELPRLTAAAKMAFDDIEKRLPEVEIMWRSTIERRVIETMEAAQGFGGAIDGVFSAIRSKNWGAAFAGLFQTFKKLKAEWATMSTEGRIGAVAGIANSIGQAIGGRTGSAISGAASGAVAGTMMFGPGIGTAVGAVVGGIASIFSSGKAKKAEKAEKERQRLADEAAKALAIENQAREINIATLQAQGKTEEALQVQRDYQLTQTAEANRDAIKALWVLEDAQRAATKAQEEAAASRNMQVRLLEALGKGEEALAITRKIEMEETREGLRGQLQLVYDAEDAARKATLAADELKAANDELSDAREREAGVIQSTLDGLRNSREAMLAFRDSLLPMGGTTNSGSALEAFRAAALQAANDNGASFDKQQAASEAYLAVSKDTATTALEELRATAAVRDALDKTLAANGQQISVAERQLASLNAAVDAVLQVDKSVKTVAELLAMRNAVAQQAAGGGAGGAGYYDGASDSWKPSATGADAQRLMANLGTFQDQTGGHYNDGGYATFLLDQFNSGGFDHLRDSEGNATGVLAQILAAGFERLGNEMAKNTAATQSTADTLDRVTQGGDAMVTQAA